MKRETSGRGSIALCVILVSLILTGGALSDEPVTNLDRFEQLYSNLAEEMFCRISWIPGSSLMIRVPDDSHDINWLIEKQIVATAQRRNISCLAWSPARGQHADQLFYRLQFRDIFHQMQYQFPSRDEITRIASADLYVKVVAPTQDILISERFEHVLRDTLQRSLIQQLSDDRYPFTRAPQNRSLFSRLIEPALVVAVTGIIVYLFFSYRSQ